MPSRLAVLMIARMQLSFQLHMAAWFDALRLALRFPDGSIPYRSFHQVERSEQDECKQDTNEIIELIRPQLFPRSRPLSLL